MGHLGHLRDLFRGMRHVAVYLDDILVSGTDDGDHLQNLRKVLTRLQDAGLKLRLDKCLFLTPSVEYLGHIISQAGLAPAPRKIEAVLKAPKPKSKKELQSYLGLVNFYRRFLPNLSTHLEPLHRLLRDGQQWAWKKEQDLAFQHSKELVVKAPVLVHFDPSKPVVLTVDASPYGVGAVLSHRGQDGQERPVAFASRGACESRCLESGVSTDPEPCGLACPRMAVRGFPVSGEKGILVVEPSPG
ncbi:uncharacterized protein ISCGN_030063 [Ixodes scapularis]